jgi:hypothetical protein
MEHATETNALEVRWFGDGAPPSALGAWIDALGATDTATRTDLYVTPPAPSSNLKLRAGGDAIELKRRLGAPERCEFGPDVTGSVEQWYKWHFPLARASGPSPDDPTGLWIPVTKTRVRHAVDDVPTDLLAHVEVTEVTARSATAWTCGLEVAGPPAKTEPVFDALASDLFGDDVPVALSAEQSVGYAEWLRRFDAAPSPAVLVPSRR